MRWQCLHWQLAIAECALGGVNTMILQSYMSLPLGLLNGFQFPVYCGRGSLLDVDGSEPVRYTLIFQTYDVMFKFQYTTGAIPIKVKMAAPSLGLLSPSAGCCRVYVGTF